MCVTRGAGRDVIQGDVTGGAGALLTGGVTLVRQEFDSSGEEK